MLHFMHGTKLKWEKFKDTTMLYELVLYTLVSILFSAILELLPMLGRI